MKTPDEKKPVREWPDLHIRLHPRDYQLLVKFAEKEQRSIGNAAAHLLTIALLSKAMAAKA